MEGKTEPSVHIILYQWEKGDMRRKYGTWFKEPHKTILLFHYLAFSHTMLLLFHSKSLTGNESDTQLLKSVGVFNASVRAGIKLKTIAEIMQ